MGLGRRIVTASALLALVSTGAVACSGGSEGDTVIAAPSALADSAGEMRSGRIAVDMGPMRMRAEFEGRNARFGFEPSPSSGPRDEDAAGDQPPAGTMLVVDGHTYLEDGDRFMEIPDDEASSFGITESDPQEAAKWLDAVRSVLRESTVSDPGIRTEDDGVPVVRYHTSATGPAAADLLRTMSGGGEPDTSVPGTSTPDEMGAPFARMDRIYQYQQDHQTVDVTGDVDEDGGLRRVTMVLKQDTSEYPDCDLFDLGFGDMRMTASEINQPQHLEAPPADRVEPYDRTRAHELTGMTTDDVDESDSDPYVPPITTDGEDDSAAADGAQTDILPDAAADTVTTATGERTVAEVLDYLRRWADAHGINWRAMALPDRPQMVAFFDQFYAQDVAERGPELTTKLGRYPRGYLAAVVTELSPGTDGATLDDAALVAAYESARGPGDTPSTSWGADMPTGPDEGADPATVGTLPGIPDVERSMEGMFKGCPA